MRNNILKYAIAVIAMIIMSVCSVSQVLAATNYDYQSVEPRHVYIQPGVRDKDNDHKFTVLSNTVEIEISRARHADKVSIGNIEAYAHGSYWIFEHYPLQPGENTITIKLQKAGSPSKDVTIIVNYVDVSAPSARHRVADITKEEKITAFDGDVVLNLGSKNAVMSRHRGELAKEQSVEINIYAENFRYRPNFIPASKLYEIKAEKDNYTLLKNGKLTLKYNTESFGHGLETLTVLWFDNYSGRPNHSVFVNLGGQVDAANKTITVPFKENGFGYYGVFNVTGAFNDFNLNNGKISWASTYVMPLYAKGIMNPTQLSSNSFGLLTWDGREQVITQGELATMLAKALGLPVQRIQSFNQDSDYGYQQRYVSVISDPHSEAAARHGLLNGIPIGDTNLVSREQAAVMIARAANLSIYDNPDLISRITGRTFIDGHDIGHWQQPYVYAAYRSKLINVVSVPNQRSTFRFNPKEPLTRVQAAEMVYKLMKHRENATN